jgi:hypothetical protein
LDSKEWDLVCAIDGQRILWFYFKKVGLVHWVSVMETATAQPVPDEFSLDISPISVTLSAEAVIHWEAVTAVDGRPAGFSLPMTLAGRVGELDFVEIVFRFRPPFWRCCFIVSSQSLDTSHPHWCGDPRCQWQAFAP